MKIKTYTVASLLTLATLISGCGSSSDTNTLSTVTTGQLVDNYIENADYVCKDGTTGITDINGTFTCPSLPVEFKISGLKLGTITQLNTDKQVFPQDLIGVNRTDLNNTDVIAMARFLQSCDDDNNTKNGIYIKDEIKLKLEVETDFNSDDINAYATDANFTLIDENTTTEHLAETIQLVENIENIVNLPVDIKNILLTPASQLTQEVKNTLAYMGNEERLAYDVYSYLYNVHLLNGQGIQQLTNIATKSETIHIQTVQLLVQKYINSIDDFANVTLDIAILNQTSG